MKTLYRDQFTPACYGVVLVNMADRLEGTLPQPDTNKRLVIAARVADRLLRLAQIEDDDDEQ